MAINVVPSHSTNLPLFVSKMNKSPVFPVASEGNHFSDYGFDPQIDYFQVLEEARRHTKRVDPRPLDSIHCKLQKPVTKDDAKSKKRRRGWWWTSALLFWRRRPKVASDAGERKNRGRRQRQHGAFSGPIYATESCVSGGRRSSRPSSGPLRAAEVGAGAVGLAYLSLRNLSASEASRSSPYAASPTAKPIYLVT